MTEVAARPAFIRLYRVRDVFDVHPDTMRRWEGKKPLKIHRRGRACFVRPEDMESVIAGEGGQEGGQKGGRDGPPPEI